MASPFKHIVVLMMENRSFDHMLGYLKAPGYAIDGLNGDETNPAADGGSAIRVSPDARSINDLTPDPGHEFQSVNMQIFSNAGGTDSGQPMMQGFVEDYSTQSGNAARAENVMKCFHERSLPVLSTLAKRYAICDRWFSSVPGSTIPNRLFAHAASSGDSLTQDAILAPATATTIFQIIDSKDNDATFRIYAAGSTILAANIYLAHSQNKFFDYSRFRQDCIDNLLPEYTFIEPSYDDDLVNGRLATSQHPDFAVDAGEAFIADVYRAVRSSPEWKDTLLLIVYDEHGGLFDHVTPPALTRDPKYKDIPPTKDFGFTFDRLGVRVPAVFISPRIKPGTILHRQFDHCSIVATVRKLFCNDKTPFNWREGQASTFDDIANLTDGDVRQDTVALPAPIASDGTIPLARDLVLSQADRDAIAAELAAQGCKVSPFPAAQPFRTAGALTTSTPTVRKPTDLTMQMAKAMAHTLNVMGMKTKRSVGTIYSAQDASDYLREANSLIAQRSA